MADMCADILANNCVSDIAIPEICYTECEKFRTFSTPKFDDEGKCIVMSRNNPTPASEEDRATAPAEEPAEIDTVVNTEPADVVNTVEPDAPTAPEEGQVQPTEEETNT